jgi:transposase-like protein
MRRRTWSAEEKLEIVLEGIKGARPVAEICREHQLAQTQYYQWRDCFLEGGDRALSNGVPQTEEALRREIEKLQRLIGKQAVALELVKKPTSLWGSGEAGGGLAGGGLVGGGGLSAPREERRGDSAARQGGAATGWGPRPQRLPRTGSCWPGSAR